MLFGDILRNLLDENDISQKQLANDLNIAAPTLGNYIRNLRQPDFEFVKCLADYFSVTTDYLLGYHSPIAHDDNENELLRIFRNLNEEQKVIYLEQGKVIVRQNLKKKSTEK